MIGQLRWSPRATLMTVFHGENTSGWIANGTVTQMSCVSLRRTCWMSKSTVDVWFAGEVTQKVTRSFCWSTTADWLMRTPVWSGTVIRTICEGWQKIDECWCKVTRSEIPAGTVFTAAHTWEWGRDSPRCPVRPRATMTRSREAERMTQNALCGKRDWEDAAESPSWGDVSTHKDQWQAFRTVLDIS